MSRLASNLVTEWSMDCLRCHWGICFRRVGWSEPDSGELRQLLPEAWVWHGPRQRGAVLRGVGEWPPIKKVSVAGGDPVTVRARGRLGENLIGVRGAIAYAVVERALTDGRPDMEIHALPLAGGAARLLKTINASQVALSHGRSTRRSHPTGGRWLAMPLVDGFRPPICTVLSTAGSIR